MSAPASKPRDIFSTVPDHDLRLSGRRRTFRRDEVVFHRDDPADGVHRVERGHFAARILTSRGDIATLALHGPGDAFGLLAVVGAEARRTATIVSLDAAETLAVSTSAFNSLRARFPGIDRATEQQLAFQLAETSDRLVEALFWPVPERIRARLRDLARLYGPATTDGTIVIPLSQEHLAGLAGTTRETVNRVLREDAAAGTLELTRNRIVVRGVE